MSSPQSVKRQKLNESTLKLRKPFVSPMRRQTPGQMSPPRIPLKENPCKANSTIDVTYKPSTLAHTVQPAHPSSSSAIYNPTFTKHHVAKPTRKQTASSWSMARSAIDPEVTAAQKAVMRLELKIKKVQNEVDVLKQAAKISSSTADEELEALKEKWRLTCQAVAEEVFGGVKERVQRMGGVSAWREMEKQKHDRSSGYGADAAPNGNEDDDDKDCEFDEGGEELPEREQEYRKAMKRQVKEEAMEAADLPDCAEMEERSVTGKVWQEDVGDDASFTMDMMLRSLNIELKVIGYDKADQRWT